MAHPTLKVGPTVVDFRPLQETAAAIAAGELTGAIHLCNAYTLALAAERPDIAVSLFEPATNLPDGTPLVWWARRRGAGTAERVYGPDLMETVIDVGRATGARHYLYGSTPDVLAGLTETIKRQWPGAEVVGTESPPLGQPGADEVGASVDAAIAAGTTVMWVGMGTPKQDLIVAEMARRHPEIASVAVGAAFDFLAGSKPQAPRWMMRLGLEWMFRLASEPRRLWRRYLVYNARFLRVLWRSRREQPGSTTVC